MKTYRLLLVIIFGLSLSACSVNEPSISEEDVVCKECEVCEVCQSNPFPEGLVLPQIYIQGKLYWTTADLDALISNIIDPIIAYYEAENQTVVSILVTTDDLAETSINTIIVEVIVSDNDGNQEPLYMGILIEKVSGVFPIWEPETINP
jgi:hypothetical protein